VLPALQPRRATRGKDSGMKSGIYEVSDVPRLMEQWRASGSTKWPALLQARAALVGACEKLIEAAAKESRGLTAEERGLFDEYSERVHDINGSLAKLKAARVAEHGADQVHLPF
jgi:hypothetical protein